MQVLKRDGRLEDVDLNKIHRVLTWAAEGLDNVSVSQVELKSHIQLYDGMQTEAIHEIMIKSAADLISESTPDYQYMAARLAVFHLRKIAYGDFTPPTLHEHAKKMIGMNLYDKVLLEAYSDEEYAELEQVIDHWRDMNLSYGAVKQLEGKYLVKNRVSGRIYESPQMLYMFAAMAVFSGYPKETRLDYVKKFYQHTSKFNISLPTPIMAGLRTKSRQFASCTVIKCDDSIKSINASTSAIVEYVSQRAGIGLDIGAIRAEGSEIRGGEAYHTGLIPFIKLEQAAVGSASQGGVRKGSATITFPLWHKDVESLLVLKNNRGVEENRARHLDYAVAINGYLYKRLIAGKDITLFSPHQVKDMYDAFYSDQDKFAQLYEQYEQQEGFDTRKISAIELFSLLMNERAGTGRIYVTNIDHMNTHGSFKEAIAPIYSSNLCQEISLPTKGLQDLNDENGEIALCTLSALNLGNIENLSDLEEWADVVVRALDAILDYQSYPVPAARIATQNRRPLGVGVINYAYYLAKNGLKYSVHATRTEQEEEANNLTHRTFEALQYYLLKASVNLAKEKGACPLFNQTKYADGILPIDTYKKDVDKLNSQPLLLDWDGLRADIVKYGLRNSTLTALMPSETSSQISGATNGIEPPRNAVSVKASKDGILKQPVPEIKTLSHAYEYLWDMPDNLGYLQKVAIMQKFVDQAISANTSYDPKKFPQGKVEMKKMITDLLTAYKYGIKTLYYHNTRDGADDTQGDLDDGCAGGACKI